MASVESKPLTCDSFSSTLINGLEKLWKENQFCDITLKVEGREFHCHRNVLAANSEYFTSVFARGFKEKGQSLINLPAEIEVMAFQTLLQYFYSGSLVLTSKNAEGVFLAADYMRLNAVIDLSAEFLRDTLDKSNCVRRFSMIDRLQFKRLPVERLYKAAAYLIAEEAAQDTATSDFFELIPALMSKIVKLNSQPERAESLFHLIVKWVTYDEENRQPLLRDLLESISLAGLSIKFFTTHMKIEPLLRRNLHSLEWLFDCVATRFINPVCVAPDPPESLFFTSRGSYHTCYKLQLLDRTSVRICDRPNISSFSAVSYKQQMHLLCGKESTGTFRFCDKQKLWVESELDFGCFSTGSILCEDDLYIIGGCTRDMYICDSIRNSCAKYSFATQQTISLPALNKHRGRPGVGLYGESIYAACGYQGASTIERYDPRENLWRLVGVYNANIAWCSSAVVEHSLYSCDAEDGSVERFDFRTNRSEIVCRLSPDGMNYWITSLNGKIYAAQSNGSILQYAKETNCWSKLDGFSYLNLDKPIILPWI